MNSCLNGKIRIDFHQDKVEFTKLLLQIEDMEIRTKNTNTRDLLGELTGDGKDKRLFSVRNEGDHKTRGRIDPMKLHS